MFGLIRDFGCIKRHAGFQFFKFQFIHRPSGATQAARSVNKTSWPLILGGIVVLFAAAAPAATDPAPAAPAAVPVVDSPKVEVKKIQSHIALLLPLQSKKFGAAAQAVKNGVLAGLTMPALDGVANLPVEVYPLSDNDAEISGKVLQAQAAGALAVIGPLTKPQVLALALQFGSSLPVPTVALNTLDSNTPSPSQLYTFPISAEQEARDVAQLAYAAGGRNAITLLTDPVFAQRIQQSFASEWQKLGGQMVGAISLAPSKEELKGLKQQVSASGADVVFLAADARKAKQIRPYLGTNLPTYATSQIYDGRRQAHSNIDLVGLHFVEMPWLVQPDHPVVLVYPRSKLPMRADLERLYALGIDAYRLAMRASQGQLQLDAEALEGVTGRISLTPDGKIQRELLHVHMADDPEVVQ